MNPNFPIDARLKNDCHWLCEIEQSQLLLMDNAAVVWFILLPDCDKTEWYQLPEKQQIRLNKTINLLSDFLSRQQHCDKINIATIGNIVSQLHIHVVGRNQSDAYWPEVVWGKQKTRIYRAEEVDSLRLEMHQLFKLEPV